MRTYVLGPLPDERLIYRAADGQVHYPHTDRRGSTVALSQGGQAVEAYAYDEFGRSGATGTSGYPYRYTGQRLDPWTGTYHDKAREYSPQLGRFLQADPARFIDGPNVYAYVGNSPWNATDPTGMQDVILQLRGYRLGEYPIGGGEFGHAYVQATDTETGQSYVGRGGPSQTYPGDPMGAIMNRAYDDITLYLQVDSAAMSPDTNPTTGHRNGAGDELIDQVRLEGQTLQEVVSQMQGSADRLNSQEIPYRPRSTNSNYGAGEVFTDVAGRDPRPVEGTRDYPGLGYTRPPPPPPPCQLESCK